MVRWIGIATILWLAGGSQLGKAWAEDVQVNTYTTHRQDSPDIAMDADGDFVVVWHSFGSAGTDSDSFSVQGQLYAADGSAVGGEFQVNTYTTHRQQYPAVAMDADGDFVVVWHSYGGSGSDTLDFSIQAQRYAADGSPVGVQFQVNTYTSTWQVSPAVAMAPDGDFVVVWNTEGSPGPDLWSSIQGQRFAADGSAVGDEFQINTYTTGFQDQPAVTMGADGDFIVVWGSANSTPSLGDFILGQRFAADGSPIGGELQINTLTTGYQVRPSVAADADGDFVVVWYNYDGGYAYGSYEDTIQGQRYASDGAPAGIEFQVNAYTTQLQDNPKVAMAAGGDFVVVWNSTRSLGPDDLFSVQGQRFAANGSAVGDEFQINTYTTGIQGIPSVAMDGGHRTMIVWQSRGSFDTDTDLNSIQRMPVELIFTDGFESGDTSAWTTDAGPASVLR